MALTAQQNLDWLKTKGFKGTLSGGQGQEFLKANPNVAKEFYAAQGGGAAPAAPAGPTMADYSKYTMALNAPGANPGTAATWLKDNNFTAQQLGDLITGSNASLKAGHENRTPEQTQGYQSEMQTLLDKYGHGYVNPSSIDPTNDQAIADNARQGELRYLLDGPQKDTWVGEYGPYIAGAAALGAGIPIAGGLLGAGAVTGAGGAATTAATGASGLSGGEAALLAKAGAAAGAPIAGGGGGGGIGALLSGLGASGSGASTIKDLLSGGSALSGLLGVGANLLSGYQNYKTQDKMADDLLGAQQEAGALLEPYIDRGKNYSGRIDSTIGDTPNYGNQIAEMLASGDLAGTYSAEDFQADPGYQFRKEEGQKALERSLASMGMSQSGAAVKEAMRFNQGLADQAYGDAFERNFREEGRKYDTLSNERNTLLELLLGQQGIGVDATGNLASLLLGGGEINALSRREKNNVLTELLSQLT